MSYNSEINSTYNDIKKAGTEITLLWPKSAGVWDPENEEYTGEVLEKFITYGLFLNAKDGSKNQVLRETKVIMIPGKNVPKRIDSKFTIKINNTGKIWKIAKKNNAEDISIEILEPNGIPIFYKVKVVL